MQTAYQGVCCPFVAPKVPHVARLICGVLFGLLVAGCQALQQVDWDGRIGRFNYEQAVAGMGWPVEEIKLSDGMRRAEWITNSGVSMGRALAGPGYKRRSMSVVPLEPTEIYRLRERYLRLTFDEAGQLVAWENGTKTED